MNVVQTDKLFQPPRERNETRSRGQFTIPCPTNSEFRSNFGKSLQTHWRSASSNRSKSSNYYRSMGRGRSTTMSSFNPGTSRNYISRSGTRSIAGLGSSTVESSGIILAITTGRGDARAEVGMAALDIRYPYMILCQISDSQTYMNTLTKVYFFDPIEILMPDTMCERVNSRSVLYRSVVDKFPETRVIPISRVHFNDANGFERLRTLCAAEYSSVELFIKQKYYALAASAALIKYVEYAQRIVYCPRSMRIEFQGSPNATCIGEMNIEQYAPRQSFLRKQHFTEKAVFPILYIAYMFHEIVDLESARTLELVQSQCGKQKNISLLGILDRCSTPMGRKLLRANILQPPCEERIIIERQSSIAELVSNRSLRSILQPIVRRLYGADRLVALSAAPVLHENSVQCAEQNLNYMLLLKNMLDVVPELEGALSSAETDLLRKIRKRLENPRFRLMKERILQTIHPDARSVSGYTSSNMQRCFAIKAGINDLLDIARRTYCELIDDMKSMVENLASRHKLPLSLGCNASQGYHIQAILPRNFSTEAVQLPTVFNEVRKNKRVYTMTTSALATLSQQCKIASEELHLMSNVLLCDLLQSVREYIGCLFQLNADVAELDLINSLAQVSSLQTYIRPTFGSKLELVDSRHPVLEVFGLDGPVPNNVIASVPWNFHIISGPNMSGKSTYLKQIVLLHVMAQIGCFVPAKQAVFRITDLIFCKIAVRDDIECNASTFALEMKEAQYILRSVTSASLIVFDELCKGTAIEEGVSIAWAICERLLTTTTAFVFVTTHFVYLTKLADLYYNVTNHYFETINAQETATGNGDSHRLMYTHRLKLGVAPTDDYGIVLAESSGLPTSVTEKSRKYASERMSSDRFTTRTTSWEHKCYNIVVQMYQLLESHVFDRKKVIEHVESIVDLRMQGGKDNVEEDKMATNNKEINIEKNNDIGALYDTTVNTVVSSKRRGDATERRTNDDKSTTCRNIDHEEITAFSARVVLTDATSQSPKTRTGNFPLQNSLIVLNRNECDVPCRQSFNSIDSSFTSYSMQTENPLNKINGATPASSNRQSPFVEKYQENAASVSSIISETDVSFPLSHALSSMQMSMLSEASVSKLYEYCLSDYDLEPSEKSHASFYYSYGSSVD